MISPRASLYVAWSSASTSGMPSTIAAAEVDKEPLEEKASGGGGDEEEQKGGEPLDPETAAAVSAALLADAIAPAMPLETWELVPVLQLANVPAAFEPHAAIATRRRRTVAVEMVEEGAEDAEEVLGPPVLRGANDELGRSTITEINVPSSSRLATTRCGFPSRTKAHCSGAGARRFAGAVPANFSENYSDLKSRCVKIR